MSSFSGGRDEGNDSAILSAGERRRSRHRRSMGRHSFSSAGSHKSFQNVTDSLQVGKLDKQINDTEKSIKALQQEIDQVQQRRQSRSIMAETEPEYFDDDKYFLRHSRPRTYKPIFTLTFAFACIVMFIVSITTNGGEIEELDINPLLGPGVDTLVSLGAKDTTKIKEGEIFRLFVPLVLHVGIIHLMVNLLGIIVIGVPMEQEFGNWRIAVISLLSGISGLLLSAILAPNVVGVGASSLVFGLLGAAWGDLFNNWAVYYGKNKGMFLQLLGCTALNFIFGLMPFVDNFAHLGGFFVGLFVGVVLLQKHYGEASTSRSCKVVFRVFSVLILPIALALMTFLLFLNVDIAENCEFCSFLSCVPFPPGASESERWWDCTPCFNGFGSFTFVTDEAINVTCPDGDVIEFPEVIDRAEFEEDFPFFCNRICEQDNL